MCALYYQWCPLLRQPSSQVNCCLASGELCSRCFKANSLLTLPAVWNSGASVPQVDYVGGRQRQMGQRRKQSLPYTRKAWWSLLKAETCVYSRQYLGEQPGLLRGRTGIKQERPSPGQQGSYVNKDHCSSKRAQKQPLPLRFCDGCNNRTTSMSQKIRGKFSVFQETPKVSEIPREGEEPPNDTLNLLVARWDEGSKESFAHSCLWFKS